MKENFENTAALAILRVSSHRQKDNASHEIQEREILEYCRDNGLRLIKMERIVESAKDSDDRKKYLELINHALKNNILHVLFYMFDREARNLTDNEKNEKLVRSGRLVLHYVRDRKIIHKLSPDGDFFLRDMQAVSNKQFIRNLSAKVSDAMRRKAEEGHYPGNHVPLGYVHQRLRDSEGREMKRGTKIVPDPDKRNIEQVRREFELRLKGLSFQEIRDQVVREHLVAPAKILSYRANTVEKRIKNPMYFGKFNWQGHVYIGKHELIIPKHILSTIESTFGKRQTRSLDSDNGIFAGGWLRCGDSLCSCQIVYDPKRKISKANGAVTKTFHYYRCSNGKKVHSSFRGMNITEEKIWKQFEPAVEGISIGPSLAQELAEALNESSERARATTRRQMAVYQKNLDDLENREDDVYDDLRKRVLDDVAYQRQIERIRQERRHYSGLLEQAQISLNDACAETAKSIIELAMSAKELWLSRGAHERRDFLDKILSNPVLNGVNIEYEMKKPFLILSKMAQSDEWRPLVEEFRTACVELAA